MSSFLECPARDAWLQYLDSEGSASWLAEMGDHLGQCLPCRREWQVVRDLVMQSAQRMGDPDPTQAPLSPVRRAWPKGPAMGAAAAVVAALGLVFSASARQVMADAFHVFVATKVTAVGFTGAQAQQLNQVLTSGGRVSLKRFGSVNVTERPNTTVQTSTAHLAQWGLPDLWPSSLGSPQVMVTTRERAVFRLDVPAINAFIKSVGGTTLFPAAVNEVPLSVTIPTSVALYPSGAPRSALVGLTEMRAARLMVPGSIHLGQVRDAILALPFLPFKLRSALSAVKNWRQTLVLPVHGTVRSFSFGGHPAILEYTPSSRSGSVVWMNRGIIVVANVWTRQGMSPSQIEAWVGRLFP